METILLEWNCTGDQRREILTKRSIVFMKEGKLREIEREREREDISWQKPKLYWGRVVKAMCSEECRKLK